MSDAEEIREAANSLEVSAGRYGPNAANWLRRAADQIESLQRENEELKAERDHYVCIPDGETCRVCGGAAITPETRERIIKMAEIDDEAWADCDHEVRPAVTVLISDLRDLLKETVEPKGRALNWVSVDEEVPVHKAAVMLWYENGAFSRGWYDESIENFRDDAFTITDNLAVTHWAIPADPTLEGEQ